MKNEAGDLGLAYIRIFASVASDPARLTAFKGKLVDGPREKEQLLGALGPMKTDIVERR